jgi:hypothetical protein
MAHVFLIGVSGLIWPGKERSAGAGADVHLETGTYNQGKSLMPSGPKPVG